MLTDNWCNHNLLYSAKPKQENLNELKQELDIDFHKVPLSDLYQRLGTNAETGLTNAQVKSNQVSSSLLARIFQIASHSSHADAEIKDKRKQCNIVEAIFVFLSLIIKM